MQDLVPGQPAPDFSLPRDGGDTVTLSDLRGGPVVLFFYPKDNTPGCTTEAVAFTGLLEDFAASGATVLGISKDSVKKHDNFVAKHDLKVALLSDADGDVCETYGVWGEKQMYGKTFEGITRATVLIDADGKVARVWPKVKVDGHAEEVLGAVRAL
ncbi:thioredoxin-dependent thiol peroxidase [Salibaculum sp.]|uniref:thioredoxin-dependent thiol peroxidase n=1 Tax=Salibaculum sp. TaxID=2855480 RepID=UPI002B468678|nr:thioredoxin-dependent thiol peroxidase [Salibaculum sp.]HKL70402.1 thioredoxin-dependent thiol peroxidase [Salibaculum sp.]